MARTGAIAICLILTMTPLAAGNGQGKGKGTGKNRHEVRAEHQTRAGIEIFAEHHHRIIREYVAAYPGGGLPPGLAKRGGALPPGLEKQLYRKGHLPPGLEKKIHPFPPDLERRLPPLAPGLRRGFIAGRAMIYNPKTSVIVDVFVPLE